MATKRVGSREVKSHFSSYLARAEKGETTIITRRGKPIARLVPETSASSGPTQEALAAFRKSLKALRTVRTPKSATPVDEIIDFIRGE